MPDSRVSPHPSRFALRASRLIPLALAWLGYFGPWLWPVPVALRLSGYDLVEWLTFAQSVRDGTYPITRLDMLWPLAGIALITALAVTGSFTGSVTSPRFLGAFAVQNWAAILLSLFAAFLILPGYPFILTAASDAELRPQLVLGLTAIPTVLVVAAWAAARPRWVPIARVAVALLSLAATLRAYALARQPIADILTRPAPVGWGLVAAIVGFAAVIVVGSCDFSRFLAAHHD
ncbi:MAG: hypothetical protein HY679_06355 [Chloroflexi bacterium]|nr:hypothetical protein [Chloroflexota bacterium]